MDLVWCRDVLPLVADLTTVYSEFNRVLQPGGKAVVYQSCFATEWLTPQEAVRLWPPLDVVPANTHPRATEAAIDASGLRVERWFRVGLEWSEHDAETSGTGGRRLLHAARLLRQPDRYVGMFGQWAYDVMLADCLWHVYRMIGKIDQRVHVLAKPAPSEGTRQE